ncbi:MULTISPECIES: hypothetical protein [unclassified Meiothermus]|uniref:hypothetical protein n=1 Tax=unclassified Meiothermus TaxID=370471 RepID=UPI000D7C4B53|nr:MULTISPECIES: hypothetical protein [unclassified Meiothermus]PZA07890.1 hypothetical protein DNA98_06195 [Meiothermus sp. Pnk-1]RYM38803.1 hypothetical protein EWH23_03490 [Meiothermus sp. PNK-Is4]
MNPYTLAWILLLLFGLINLGMAWSFLRPRNRLNLMWLPGGAVALSYLLFALFPGALTLLAFPILQTLAFQALLRLTTSHK